MFRDFCVEAFDVIIQAGQSNSEGCGVGDTIKPFAPSDKIYYLLPDLSVERAQEEVRGNMVCSNFSLSFAQKYIDEGRLQNGRKLLILRSAVGGTGFLDNRWKLTDDLYLQMTKMIETALKANPQNRLVAFLWHQGETDVHHNATQELHYKHLSMLVSAVRKNFCRPDLPFIAGDFVEQWKEMNLSICAPVINAIKKVCADIGNARFVRTDGLGSNFYLLGSEESIHFCREALYTLGLRYYHAFCDIVSEQS